MVEVFVGGLEEGGDFRGVGYVGADGDAATAHGLDFLDCLPGWGGGGRVVDDDVGAVVGEFEGVLAAHSSG